MIQILISKIYVEINIHNLDPIVRKMNAVKGREIDRMPSHWMLLNQESSKLPGKVM